MSDFTHVGNRSGGRVKRQDPSRVVRVTIPAQNYSPKAAEREHGPNVLREIGGATVPLCTGSSAPDPNDVRPQDEVARNRTERLHLVIGDD